MNIMIVQESNGDIITATEVSDAVANDISAVHSISDLAEYFCQTVTFLTASEIKTTTEQVEEFLRNLNPSPEVSA